MLIVHHLGKSQSERIVWLCEELDVPYELKHYERHRTTMLAPPEFKALHPLGVAPVITEGDLVLAESGAIIEYVIAKYGAGRLAVAPSQPEFADYLFWFHFGNGTLQPVMSRNSLLRRMSLPTDNPVVADARGRLDRALAFVDRRLVEADYLAGHDFTAADIMAVFSFTTMRFFLPMDLTPYPHILAYLQRIGRREAYQRAMRKGDPDLPPALD